MIGKRISILMIAMVLALCGTVFTACGGEGQQSEETQTQQQATEETVQAADPMTEEEMEKDDSEGCIEDSEDLLY